ncbi:MAG TPA: ABC transporter substrate-binding protein [Actinophytocola sp.]|uniref:ABC transporter substrate-binding protein n=1 Tax=Actinophytocola sp. TaxID=1872138 RepID=UPI002DDD1061|nr:ABC transporter substrate-binding protein [Actinophytocola sp.]HEV2782572.1 ABC transporter substrate-binding protein [Actinophytocola sp.]
MTACGGDEGGGSANTGSTTPSNEPVELTIATFGEFGYEDLLIEYHNLHPNVTIKHNKVAQGGPFFTALQTKLRGGQAECIVGIEEGHLSEHLKNAQLFNNLEEIGPKDVTKDRWLSWKYEAAKAKNGSLIGYGTDIGPLAMAYRKDLLEAAGMKTDDASIKSMFATWDSFFAAGDQYVKATGKPWFDSASQVFNAMVNQLPNGYINKSDDQLAIESNADIKKAWDQVTAAVARGQSAKLTAFSPEWQNGFKAAAFATKTAPAWMLGVIEGNAGPENAGKWAVTDAFPNGGGNWGGSYLGVPKSCKTPQQAAELAAWLTAPEQQLKAFKAKKTFPSQVKALESPDLLNSTSEYFGGIKVGELYANMARKVGPPQYKGPGDASIQENATSPALQAVEQGKSAEEGWQQAVDAAKKIVK